MTHFAGKAAKVLFLSVVTTLLLAATALAADQAVAVGSTTGSSLRMLPAWGVTVLFLSMIVRHLLPVRGSCWSR